MEVRASRILLHQSEPDRRITLCDATSGDHFFSRGRRPTASLAAERIYEGPGLSIGRMKVCNAQGRSGRRLQ